MNLKLKALTYTVGILLGISTAIGISFFLVVAFVTPLILSWMILLFSTVMAGSLVYTAVMDSLNNTINRKNKNVQ